MKNKMDDKIAIIDMDSVVFTAANPNKVLGDDGEPLRTEDGKRFVYVDKTEAELIESCDWVMNDILKSCEATHYIAYIKGKNTGFRKQYNPDYKSNRPTTSPIWWEFVKNYMIEKWRVIEVNNIEVDDAISITIQNLENSFPVAIDKDVLNLEGLGYNWRKKEWISTTKWEAYKYFFKSMIIGDTADAIKGIVGMGEVAAEKNLADTTDYAERVLSIYIGANHSVDKGIEEYYKTYKSLKLLDSFEGFEIPQPIEYKILNDFVEDINGIN